MSKLTMVQLLVGVAFAVLACCLTGCSKNKPKLRQDPISKVEAEIRTLAGETEKYTVARGLCNSLAYLVHANPEERKGPLALFQKELEGRPGSDKGFETLAGIIRDARTEKLEATVTTLKPVLKVCNELFPVIKNAFGGDPDNHREVRSVRKEKNGKKRVSGDKHVAPTEKNLMRPDEVDGSIDSFRSDVSMGHESLLSEATAKIRELAANGDQDQKQQAKETCQGLVYGESIPDPSKRRCDLKKEDYSKFPEIDQLIGNAREEELDSAFEAVVGVCKELFPEISKLSERK